MKLINNHISENKLFYYLVNGNNELSTQELEHFHSCPDCQKRLMELDLSTKLIDKHFVPDSIPDRINNSFSASVMNRISMDSIETSVFQTNKTVYKKKEILLQLTDIFNIKFFKPAIATLTMIAIILIVSFNIHDNNNAVIEQTIIAMEATSDAQVFENADPEETILETYISEVFYNDSDLLAIPNLEIYGYWDYAEEME